MFEYKKINNDEIQISDYPYGLTVIPSIIIAITTYSLFFTHSYLLCLLVIAVCFIFILRLKRKETNINFKTHTASLCHRSLFDKKYYMLNLNELEVVKHRKKILIFNSPVISLKDKNDKSYTIIDADIIQKRLTKIAFKKLKNIFNKHNK